MKIFHVVSGIKPESGGPSYTVPALCESLAKLGASVEINTLDERLDFACGFQPVIGHERSFPRRLGVSSSMRNYLLLNANKGDILHVNGLWMMPNIYPGNVANHTGAKLILSPHGMLSEWSLNQRKTIKTIVGVLGQNRVILNADCIHVTAECEYDDVRSFGYKGPVAVIPNGVDIPSEPEKKFTTYGDKKKIIFISRVHPKKGIELLLNAWSNINHLHQDWELVICGPGEFDYVESIKRVIAETSNGRASYLPPVYGEDKNEFYRRASLFVLPTHSENFGVVVAEALSYGIPAIVTKGAPWSGLVENSCGWWINNTVSELEETLNYALTLPEEQLYVMGNNGRVWMEKDFSWAEIGREMLSVYRWVNNVAEKPDCVILD